MISLKIKNSLICLLLVFVANFGITEASISPAKVKERFDEKITTFIQDRGFPGAVLAIYKDGNPILNESFGVCADDQVYPIASLSKLFTEIAISRLITEKAISPDTRVYDYLGFNYQPRDARIKNITIRNLIEHKGGWDRDISGDPLFRLQELFPNEDPSTINKQMFIKFVLTKFNLDHQPGQVASYSNFGYLLLGAVIEKASHRNFVDYINGEFARPAHVELYQASTPHHYSREIPYPDCFSLELSSATFGLAAKISDVAYYFTQYDRKGEGFSPLKNRMNWWKDGSLPGTATLMLRQRINNVVIVVYIPDRDENNWTEDNAVLKTLIDNTANSVGL